ncbi:amidase [Phenylobacterium sp. SCN 70-31]|uniref:amidase n=1 Tax=Phenylobacterium sp. SCN 70-31 TaxID=1660129 RepID=UPI00086B9F77|nr:amidase [Phenylobacterium sp. SCN 70-31]ODT89868.1 MAG: 6-aminohexanoate hydrolase [Phenylobacterium sp. SCN 70-31]
MDRITRRAFGGLSAGALSFGTLAAQAHAKAPAARSAWPDAVETAQAIRSGKTTSAEAVKAAIDATVRLQPQLGFLVASDFDRAIAKAQARPASGPFAGVPFLIKDLDDYAGLPTRSGSRIQLGQPSATASTPFGDACDRAGFVVIGKSSTPEFGFLPTTEPVAFGPTRNPWDPARSSGGSSGGAAVAVAAGVVPIAHASDGGGSIRIPASCCGLFGLKPSRGRMVGTREEQQVSDISVEHVVSRSVRDSATAFAATEDAGPGARFAPVGLVTRPLRRRLRVGLILDGGAGDAPDPEVRTATERAAKLMEGLGHRVTPTKWPIATTFIQDFLLLWASGAKQIADAYAQAAGRPADTSVLEPFSLGMAEMAAKAAPDALPAAVGRLTEAVRAYDAWFADGGLDVVLSPVLAAPPPLLGYVGPNVAFDTLIERLIRYVGYTTLHNVAGAPSMSVPLHWTESGLPIGTQIAARAGQEGLLLQLAYQLEGAQPWAHRKPPVSA